jgi:signal transduction histidine kinase
MVSALELSVLHGWAGETASADEFEGPAKAALEELNRVNQRFGSIMKVDEEIKTLTPALTQGITSDFNPNTVDAVQKFIAHINDVSNLILDPDLDSYYFMDASMLIFPEIYPTIGDLARTVAQLGSAETTQPQTITPELRAVLTQKIGVIRSGILRQKRGMQVARRNNPSGLLRAETFQKSEETMNSIELLAQKIESLVDQGSITAEATAPVVTQASETLHALATFWFHTLDKLEELLQRRISGFESKKVQALTGVGLGLLFSFLLTYWIVKRINTRLHKLREIAHRISDKSDIDAQIENDIEVLVSRDEIGDLANTLGVMTTKLRLSIDEIRMKTDQLEQINQSLEGRVARRTAEIQKKNDELQSTLEQLQKTKDQLIVQEKMASLGSLTAGIAHEIKNPLNFVNNFAELSAEIVTEIREILEGLDAPLPENLAADIDGCLDDLEQNVNKIHEHGKRADSIVKGMLQHSRSGSHEFTRTNVNSLLEEYVNLAYHGLRAQDSSFNVTIEKEMDRSLPDVMMVSQDVSRVFLNIVNNACYAANKKKHSGQVPDTYMPTISVATRRLNDRDVEVRIKDNGTGMPESVRAKIFEPFFTTKPTGEGTGLGLSLSYDIIVQQHHGTLEVNTVDGEGTEFVITLPINQEAATA